MIKLITRRILGSLAETVCVCALCNTASQITRPISSPIVRCEVTIPSGLAIVSKIIDTDVMLKSGQDKKGHKIFGPSYFVTALVKFVCSFTVKLYERNLRFRQLPPKTMNHSIAIAGKFLNNCFLSCDRTIYVQIRNKITKICFSILE